MSHFTVLVIGNDIDAQLAPYQENNMGDCPKEYLEFNDVQDEEMERYETELAPAAEINGKLISKYDIRAEGRPTKDVPIKQIYKTFETFMKEYAGYKTDSKTGRYGYWSNPNAKWDWYKIGGRWTGFFPLKPGCVGELGIPGVMTTPAAQGYADSVKKGDIDFVRMRLEKIQSAQIDWEKAQNEKDPKWARYMYNIIENETCEEYIERQSRQYFSTFAVLKDGNWYEKGEMGWWGHVAGEKTENDWKNEFNNLIESLPDETLLTIIDCHI